VGSLWSTADRTSREFVERFYSEGGGSTPALALARTQQAWIAEKRPVRDWSGFAFFGAASPAPASLARAEAP
jgi:CHAT domain-containing protein